MALQWQVRRDTANNWTNGNPIIAEGEFGIELESLNTPNLKLKIGDGVSAWVDLEYTLTQGEAGADGSVGTDGDSAYDIAVTGGFVGTETQWLATLKGDAGIDGVDGEQGLQGVPGTPGSDATDKNYIHTQLSSETVWTITHPLSKYVSIVVVDSGGNKVFGKEEYISVNEVKITFTAAFSGYAYLN
tara:strand:- start:107 stop:667 length:561 start_codon:yes stop_codon:yes gene_type:complete